MLSLRFMFTVVTGLLSVRNRKGELRSTVPVPSESLLDDMEQLLRSPLEEFDLVDEDSARTVR